MARTNPPQRAKIPSEAKIWIELGTARPSEAGFDPFGPFQMLWVITNGSTRRKFLWVVMRKTGLYVASGAPDSLHTSYHVDGTFHWKLRKQKLHSSRKPPLREISEPVIIQNATTNVGDEALEGFELAEFSDQPVDAVIYLDNRMLPQYVSYEVLAVPPF